MHFLLKILVVISCSYIFSSQLFAQQSSQLQNVFIEINEQINREPWLSYQELEKLKPANGFDNSETELWWLLRKAQAEDLLYFHQEFTATVAQAQALVTLATPPYISATLNVFSGIVARREGRYQDSVDLLRIALEQAKQHDLNHIFVIGKQELGYTRSLSELYETSLVELQEAYVEAYALDDHFLIAEINDTYGAIYGYMGDYAKSIEYYEKALDSFKSLGYRAHLADATYGMAATYRYWKKYDLAIAKFELYRQQTSYTPNQEVSFFGVYGLGMTLAEKGDCLKAVEMIDQALQLNGQIDYNAELYKRKASCLIQLGQQEQAEVALQQATEIFDSLPELAGSTWQLEVQKVKAELEFSRGNIATAYQLIKDYYDKYTTLYDEKSASKIISIRTALEVERHNIEIALLQQRSKVQLLQVEREQQQNIIQRYFIGFVLVVMAIVLYAFIVQRRNNQKILALSIIDPLSGLHNRRYVFDHLNQMFEQLSPDKTELSVIMFDIDNFKLLNDRYGHPFGDQVIKEVANVAKTLMRTEDTIGRVGGEEFLCILPRTNIEKCNAIAERLRKKVGHHNFITNSGEIIHTTVSIGIANASDKLSDANLLYAAVDKAMYQSKAAGKNRVMLAK